MMLEELGSRIRAQREKRGLKQQDIANALNISPQAVSKWERGENAPDIATLAPLARLLGVSIDWLLAFHQQTRDVFEATVLISSVRGAYDKSTRMLPRDFAAWANGIFFTLTELTLRHDGVPVKYLGDRYLCFFSGVNHRARALETATVARNIIHEDIRIGLASGDVYLGSVGHPDYARPDIMGEVVNIAFITMEWAETHAESGLAAAEPVLVGISPTQYPRGQRQTLSFRESSGPVPVYEIRLEAPIAPTRKSRKKNDTP